MQSRFGRGKRMTSEMLMPWPRLCSGRRPASFPPKPTSNWIRPNSRIAHLVHPEHKRVILWDNNVLGESHWPDVAAELQELGVEVDIHQGLDARLVTGES